MLGKALLSASVSAPGLPNIGDSYQGGFFAGYISHSANGVATHGLIVAPRATGDTSLQWKTTTTFSGVSANQFNGAVNSAAINNADHPAAQYCEGLTIGGYSDWYLPARYELEIAYYNLKPTTTGSNGTNFTGNSYSVPQRTTGYAGGIPAQTSVLAFRNPGGAEYFSTDQYWASNETTTQFTAWTVNFGNGDHFGGFKTNYFSVRAFRKFSL